MKKSGIKVLALFLSMALCLSLGGCGKEKTTSEKDGSNVGLIDFDRSDRKRFFQYRQ